MELLTRRLLDYNETLPIFGFAGFFSVRSCLLVIDAVAGS